MYLLLVIEFMASNEDWFTALFSHAYDRWLASIMFISSSKHPSCVVAPSNKIKEFILLIRDAYLLVKMKNVKVFLDYIKWRETWISVIHTFMSKGRI